MIVPIIAGFNIYANAPTEPPVDEMLEMEVNMTNAQIEGYLGDNVRGTVVASLLQRIEILNSSYTFPIPIVIIFEDGLSEATISRAENYKVEAKDNLPQGETDGYYDTIIISKVK
jgi:hypothetical protein